MPTNINVVKCSRTRPKVTGVDAEFIAISEDGLNSYLCKSQNQNPHLPLIEWICCSLTDAIKLPTPKIAVVEMISLPNVFLFGSLMVEGVTDYMQALNRVTNNNVFSSALAIDYFVHNTDRHLGNYLFLDKQSTAEIMLIDFSRSLMYHGWPIPNLPLAQCNTLTEKSKWMTLYGYKDQKSLLDTIRNLPHSWMEERFNEIPTSWFKDTEKNILCDWWASNQRGSRLDDVLRNLP